MVGRNEIRRTLVPVVREVPFPWLSGAAAKPRPGTPTSKAPRDVQGGSRFEVPRPYRTSRGERATHVQYRLPPFRAFPTHREALEDLGIDRWETSEG